MRAGLKGCVHRCPPGLPASETLACQGLVSFSPTSSPEDTSNIFRGQIYKSFSIFKRLKMPAIVLAHTSTSQSVTLELSELWPPHPKNRDGFCFSFVLCCAYSLSCIRLFATPWTVAPGSSVHGDSPGKNTGVGCHALRRGSSQTRY